MVYRSNVVVDSPPGGNANGRFDPGETGTIIVTLHNSGTDTAESVIVKLRSYLNVFTITDSLSDYGSIAPGADKTNAADRFAAHADGAIPPGTVVTCSLFVHCEEPDYDWAYGFRLQVGRPPNPPGTVLWGPKVCPGMPTSYGLYGAAYNPTDGLLYCTYYMNSTLYKYTSDSMLQAQGTIALPEDSCTDIDYCAYDNTFWVVANASKQVYKLTPTGSVVRQFSVPQPDYPCGIVENDAEHKLYVTDRRLIGQSEQRLFIYDTLGNVLDTFIHPVAGYYGSRCLALDEQCPTNPPSLLNIYTWFNTGGTAIDSIGMLELDRVNMTLLNRVKFADPSWNIRGIEYDPRDGTYWVTIMQGSTSNNLIFKVEGFNPGVAVAERTGVLPRQSGLAARARPNPFTRQTSFTLDLAGPGPVDLFVYDNAGRLVRVLARGARPVARAGLVWDGRDEQGRRVVPGVYLYRLVSGSQESWGKVVAGR